MRFPDTSYNLRIELDTKNCDLSAGEIELLEKALTPLRKPVEHFPVSDLYITITYQPRSHVYRVKTALVLSGKTLATGDVEDQVYPAFERCVRKLVRKIKEYEASLAGEPDLRKIQKGTHHEILPEQQPDIEAVEAAIQASDYAAFRDATLVYEEPIRKRIGRWIRRYPEIEERVGDDLSIADMVEELFLNAFERYEQRPDELRFGEWLEHLIDPSVRLLAEHPSEEGENISFARSLWETE